MPAAEPSPDTGTPHSPAGPPCDRCGTFVAEGKAVLFLDKRYCQGCFEHVARDVRVWPWGFIVGFGGLTNVAFGLILLALSWQRLGEKKRARGYWIAAVVALVVLGIVMALPDSRGIGCGLSLALIWFMSRDYRPVWTQLKAAGSRRAGVAVPIVLAVAGAFAMGVLILLITEGPAALTAEP